MTDRLAAGAAAVVRGGDRRWSTRVALFALVLTLLCAFVPWAPGFPGASLDESWLFGINQAMAQGAVMGSDLVFTYGPYASVYTRNYHPVTDALMLWSSAYLALSYGLASVLLTVGRPWGWVLALTVIVAALLPYPRDTLLFSYPLIAALSGARLLNLGERGRTAARHALVWLVPLFMPLGLLPLIKGSVLILCVAVGLICMAFFAADGLRRAALLCGLVPVLSAGAFWILARQPLSGLPAYIVNMVPIASGYTEAMAIPGKSSAIWDYLLFCALFFWAVWANRSMPRSSRLFVLALFLVYFFITFKGSFVRHDSRAVGAAATLLLAVVVLAAGFRVRLVWLLCGAALLSWWDITRHHYKPLEMAAGFFVSTYRQAWSGLEVRLRSPEWPRSDFDAAVSALKAKASFPAMAGTADIYGHGQSYLIASGATWNMRPVLQSYSAYLPVLAEMNRQHLTGSAAPDHVVFKLEPIDGRFPSLDDGPSWPALLGRYEPERVEGEYLFLHKRDSFADDQTLVRGARQEHHFGERIQVPSTAAQLYAEIDIEPNLLGSLAHTLFKPTRLEVDVELVSGVHHRFRLIAGMARSAFLITPLVQTTEEFALLYGSPAYLQSKRVRSIAIAPVEGHVHMWKERFGLRFSQVTPPSAEVAPDRLRVFDKVLLDDPARPVVMARTCTAGIDSLNGAPPPAGPLAASGTLQVTGWAAAAMAPAALPEAVLVVLTSESGQRSFVQARRTQRLDVAAFTRQPVLADSGYSATVDLSAFVGRYRLGLALKQADKIELCPEPKIVADLRPVAGTSKP